MAVTNVALAATQQQTFTNGVETFLTAAPVNTSGVYVMIVDVGNATSGGTGNGLQNGDVVEFRIYSVVQAGTEQVAYYAVYANLQGQPVKYSVPVPLLNPDTLRFSVKITTAINRTFRCRIVTIG